MVVIEAFSVEAVVFFLRELIRAPIVSRPRSIRTMGLKS